MWKDKSGSSGGLTGKLLTQYTFQNSCKSYFVDLQKNTREFVLAKTHIGTKLEKLYGRNEEI